MLIIYKMPATERPDLCAMKQGTSFSCSPKDTTFAYQFITTVNEAKTK